MLSRSILWLLLCAAFAPAQTIRRVPSDFATIQAAIAASAGGDVVSVLPGVHLGPMDYQGKNVLIVSAAGPLQTAITLAATAAGSLVSFQNGETSTAILDGFTLTGGLGAPDGGGILISGASPTIRRCRIVANTTPDGTAVSAGVTAGSGGDGAGICVVNHAHPTFEDCEIANNAAGGGGAAFGMGAAGDGGCGGGIFCDGLSSLVITRCRITGNRAGAGGEAMDPGSGTPGASGCGGGIALGAGCSAVVNESVIAANSTANGRASDQIALPGGDGGGVWSAGDVMLTNSVLAENTTGSGASTSQGSSAHGGYGAAIAASGVTQLRFCTLRGNTAAPTLDFALGYTYPGYALRQAGGFCTIENSILWDLLSPSCNDDDCGLFVAAEIEPFSVPFVSIASSDVRGGFTGIGSIDVDPLFASDHHLMAGSPCIDAGDLLAPNLPPTDVDGNPRLLGLGVDMGADEFVCGFAASIASADPQQTLTLQWSAPWVASPLEGLLGASGADAGSFGLYALSLAAAPGPAFPRAFGTDILLDLDPGVFAGYGVFLYSTSGDAVAPLYLGDPAFSGTVIYAQVFEILPISPPTLRGSNALALHYCP